MSITTTFAPFMNRNEKILLFVLASINFTHILDFMIIMPLGNYLMPYFHITTQQFSLIVSAYSYAAFTSGIIAAFGEKFTSGFLNGHVNCLLNAWKKFAAVVILVITIFSSAHS